MGLYLQTGLGQLPPPNCRLRSCLCSMDSSAAFSPPLCTLLPVYQEPDVLTAVRAVSPPCLPGGIPGPLGLAPQDQPQLCPQEGPARMFQDRALPGTWWVLSVWPLFTRMLFGFLFEVYDPPAFQDPTTHKFRVAVSLLFHWASRAEAF